MIKRVLIVSPHFPPVNAPDMQRIRTALPCFITAGWDVTVLTVADPTPSAPVEPELLSTLPSQVRIVRSHCCSRRWTALLGVNNVGLRSLPFLFMTGCRLLSARRYDVIYFSTTMFITLPLGRLWKGLYGVPYVIDLQDPWVNDYYERPGAPRPPGGWKYQLARITANALEGWTMRGLAHLIMVSEAYHHALRRRHPELNDLPATELPFGSPDPDLEYLRSNSPQRPRILPGDGFRLAFAGALGPGQLLAVEVLFAALSKMAKRGLVFSIHFFGTSYSPNGTPATLALAAKYGLSDRVHEQAGRLRYFDALQVTLEADINLLFGSNDLAFTPSKTLALLAADRPLLALAPVGSALIARLRLLGAPCIAFQAGADDATAIDAVVQQVHTLMQSPASSQSTARNTTYSAQAVAIQQLEILAAASRN